MAFYIAQTFPFSVVRASDSNLELHCFWNQLKMNSESVINGVQDIFDSKDDGRELFNRLIEKRNSNLNDLERAIDFFVLNRITFSGVVDAGGYSEASFNNRFTQSSIERLRKAASLVEKIEFYNEDYSYLINLDGDDVFIFLDPPYYSVSKSRLYGKKGILHSQFDHDKFALSMKECKHKWLITYDNSEYVKKLFQDFYQVEWELQYGMNNYKQVSAAKGKELLIANYNLDNYL